MGGTGNPQNSVESNYFVQVRDGYIRFQTGQTTAIPKMPVESNAKKVRERATLAAAQEIVAASFPSFKELRNYQTYFGKLYSNFGSYVPDENGDVKYTVDAKGKPTGNVRRLLDVNQDGALADPSDNTSVGNFLGSKEIGDDFYVAKDKVDEFTRAYAYAMAVARTHKALMSGRKATEEETKVNIPATQAHLKKNYPNYSQGFEFNGYNNEPTQLINAAMGNDNTLLTLPKTFQNPGLVEAPKPKSKTSTSIMTTLAGQIDSNPKILRTNSAAPSTDCESEPSSTEKTGPAEKSERSAKPIAKNKTPKSVELGKPYTLSEHETLASISLRSPELMAFAKSDAGLGGEKTSKEYAAWVGEQLAIFNEISLEKKDGAESIFNLKVNKRIHIPTVDQLKEKVTVARVTAPQSRGIIVEPVPLTLKPEASPTLEPGSAYIWKKGDTLQALLERMPEIKDEIERVTGLQGDALAKKQEQYFSKAFWVAYRTHIRVIKSSTDDIASGLAVGQKTILPSLDNIGTVHGAELQLAANDKRVKLREDLAERTLNVDHAKGDPRVITLVEKLYSEKDQKITKLVYEVTLKLSDGSYAPTEQTAEHAAAILIAAANNLENGKARIEGDEIIIPTLEQIDAGIAQMKEDGGVASKSSPGYPVIKRDGREITLGELKANIEPIKGAMDAAKSK